MTDLQLTLDGGEIPHSDVLAQGAHLSNGQREILRTIRLQGYISSSEAGRIIHAHRDPPCNPSAAWPCCHYMASDGSDACRRLARRGLVRRLEKFGGWTFT